MTLSAQSEIQEYRPYLMRYALLQLRDQDLAEDVVQETLLAAIRNTAGFSGKSSRKTWLTGILKHKIIDALRRKSREQPLGTDEDGSESDVIDALFANNGHWAHAPSNWADPEGALERGNFWSVFEACSERLPERTARVFMMREVMELSTEEICRELAITPANLWVLLHRARLVLRECLDIKWFGGPGKS